MLDLNRFGFPVALVAAICAAGTCSAQPSEPCFAFLLKGDVVAACGGKTVQITRRGDIERFAISEQSSSLAWVASRFTKRDATTSSVSTTGTVVDLKTRASRQSNAEGAGGLVSSCGSILEIRTGTGGATTTDVVTGEAFGFAPYAFFRCSTDRQIIAGVVADRASTNQHGDMFLGVGPERKIAAAGDVDPHFFSVSPDGTKIAWFNGVRPLCVASLPGPAQCVDHSTMSDPVAVNNAGEVLAASGTGKGCFYKTSYNFSAPQRGERDNDECLGIGYWKAGLKTMMFVVPIGRNPQWLSPATADLLRQWADRSSR